MFRTKRGERARLVRPFFGFAVAAAACAGQPPPEPSPVPRAATENHALAPAESPSAAAPSPAPPADNRIVEPTAPVPEAAEAIAAKPDAPAPPPANPSATVAESPALSTLKSYYTDLNGRKFEAARYFAPRVKQYITMQRPSTSALNHYIRDVFPKQFESYEFLFDEPSLHEEGPNVYTYLERCRYYVVKAHEFRMILAQVRVELDADGKIVEFRHAKVLARESTPEQR